MCWNKDVSLNTFLFSGFILLLVIYNNNYTQYKSLGLDNFWMYVFFASFILMQLIEHFIWRNIDNAFYNNMFSTMATILVTLQPAASLMLLTSTDLRNTMLGAYSALAIPYVIYKLFIVKTNPHSEITKKNHLQWRFVDAEPIVPVIWFTFFFFSLIYEKIWGGIGFGLLVFALSYYNYKTDQSMFSMWCWMVNAVMIYYAASLMFYLPYKELFAL